MKYSILFLISSVFANTKPVCEYVNNPKTLKSSYSSLCYAEVNCSVFGVDVFNTVACQSNKDGACPTAEDCLNDTKVTFLNLKISTLENTQKKSDSEGVGK
ncbi:MAG: hypothetical protein COV57_03135 [Candidatus Liptonbacteria bacterium CG11_big_fil_rev_8_21_14_0_20_35_14]|uniref:Uncharacterized protein n=1 Tax=Candidatus Liptonbacteria bacterium CG11_big_fil_rev_8_21_14_0_20_35_14 TaxID=1974634 RepID=A0A2H0N706_9BACT|nr:MAG: hypothetical protein COV57_03135 [Candidatus Liptonbacteria bacterium CG11_big_fil_rev_8_21_14_0_20_35_14]PJB52572.1 MAG: hypothetical protein CO099_11960 [Bdellovibrio sp. CG_4_9_14_3_um_filter_39_7]